MAWFYEVRDLNKAVAETGKGFATRNAAMAAGRKKARELKASSSLPVDGVGTVMAGQDSEVQTGVEQITAHRKNATENCA